MTTTMRAIRACPVHVRMIIVLAALIPVVCATAFLCRRRVMYDRVMHDLERPPFKCDAAMTTRDGVGGTANDDAWLGDIFDTVMKNQQYQIEADYERKTITQFQSYTLGNLRREALNSVHVSEVKIADLRQGMRVLDLGCGVGNFAVYACLHVPDLEVTCVTNSHRLCDTVRANARSAGLSDNQVVVLCVDFDTWTPPAGAYDRVVSLESIGYSQDRSVIFRKLHASLRPGGMFCVKTPTFRDPVRPNGVSWGVAAQLIGVWQYDFSTPGSLVRAMSDAGFSAFQSSSYSMITNTFFLNPSDWLSFFRYFIGNGMRIRDHLVSANPCHALQNSIIRAHKGWDED